jgi:hypothetical protein
MNELKYKAICTICDSEMFAISEADFYENKYTCEECWI